MKTAPKLSVGDIQAASEDLVQNAIALHPKLPFADVFEKIIELAEPEFLAALDQLLRMKYLRRINTLVRSKSRPKPAPLFHYAPIQEAALALPARLKLKDGKIVTRAEYSFDHLKRIVAIRTAQHRGKKESDPVILAAEKLMAEWPARSKKLQGLTLSEVDQQKAKKAGLI